MALKPDREVISTDISYYVNSITGPSTTRMERGGVVCAATNSSGLGASMDSLANAVSYVTDPSGYRVIGVLLNDFVNIDLSRQTLNPYKDESQIGMKAVVLDRGWIVTNMIDSTSATGSVPAIAYAGPSGLFTQTSATGRPTAGEFVTRKDADGYAKIRINLP